MITPLVVAQADPCHTGGLYDTRRGENGRRGFVALDAAVE